MRELEERENRDGYWRELEERLALPGEEPIVAFDPEDELYAQAGPGDEDLDEDELEDEEELFLDVMPEELAIADDELARAGGLERGRRGKE